MNRLTQKRVNGIKTGYDIFSTSVDAAEILTPQLIEEVRR